MRPILFVEEFFLLKWDKARNILKKNLHNNNVCYSFFEIKTAEIDKDVIVGHCTVMKFFIQIL